MKADVPELLFPTRADFRAWLYDNAETAEAAWLVFGKKKGSSRFRRMTPWRRRSVSDG